MKETTTGKLAPSQLTAVEVAAIESEIAERQADIRYAKDTMLLKKIRRMSELLRMGELDDIERGVASKKLRQLIRRL